VEDAGFFRNPCQAVETEHFRLIHDMPAAKAERIADVLEFAYKQFELRFKGYGLSFRAPDEALVWMCFRDSESFVDYASATEEMDLSWLSGYYSSRTNRVAVVRPRRIRKWSAPLLKPVDVLASIDEDVEVGLVQIIHEAGHQLAFNTGLQQRGVMYPLWASEGIALLFEDCASEYLPAKRYSEGRQKRLLELHREGLLFGLEEFAVLTRLPADRHAADVYAQAWGFFSFLCENRRTQLQNYFSHLSTLKSRRSANRLRREFVEAFGPMDQLDREWSLFLELSAPTQYMCRTNPVVDQ